VLFGYHKGGTEFIKTFQAMHKSFVVVDYDPDVIKKLATEKLAYRYGDAADLELLEELSIEKAKMVISTITDFETNLGLVRHIGVINPQAVIICHADHQAQALDLYRLGATYVILPHYISSRKIGDIIKRHGISKEEFEPYREAQIADLARHQDI
jgi:voltage-gated potassium channel Kch